MGTGSQQMARPGRRGALTILRRVRAGEIDPADITRHERRACVAYLRLEGYTGTEIAEVFHVHRQTIARDETALRKETARLIDDVDVRAVAGGLVAWATHLTAKAMKDKDYGLVWKIQRELMGDLQSLGYLPKAPEQHDVRIGTFVDLARLAVEQGQARPDAEPTRALPAPAVSEDDDKPGAEPCEEEPSPEDAVET